MSATSITVPKGKGRESFSLDMTNIYHAEARLSETKMVTPMTAPELRGTFNEACNETTKFLAWIKYELLVSKKELDLVRAEIVMDRYPEAVKKLREAGMKDNADYRDSFVVRDVEYQNQLNIQLTLEATASLLKAKAKTFERAYWDCRDIAKDKTRIGAQPNFNTSQDSTQGASNFMGTSEFVKK